MRRFFKALARSGHETDFLPAAVEILERPPSPAGRAVLWGIFSLLGLMVVWAWFGHMDVVVTAPGRLVPREHVKVIQASELGVVRSILVENGQAVAAGDPLLVLDPTSAEAERNQIQAQLLLTETEMARNMAIVAHLNGEAGSYHPPEGLTAAQVSLQHSLVASTIAEYEARLAVLQQSRLEKEQKLEGQRLAVAKGEALIPLQQEQVDARQYLLDHGTGSRLVFLETVSRLTDMQKQLEMEKQVQEQMVAEITLIDRQVDEVRAEFRKTTTDALANAQTKALTLQQELAKAEQRVSLQTLTAPVSGTVQQLAMHTTGGVVQPAQALMVIVPDGTELVAEASIPNKDAAWIKAGHPVEIKIQAYPFTEYGTIAGTLESISGDAISDEKLGMIYQAYARLSQQSLRVKDRSAPLAPGMEVVLEVKIGERRIMEYFLAPILKTTSEAARER